MGIPGFTRWILSTFPQIVRVQTTSQSQLYDHVAIDVNQILHVAARKSSDRYSLIAAVFRELDAIFRSCVPKRSIFFAFDGPAPLAKLVTQRKHREKGVGIEYIKVRRRTGRQNRAHPHNNNNNSASAAAPNALRAFDRLEFTPGVDAMYHVRDAVQYWAYMRLQTDPRFAHLNVWVSGADVPGEGELKIIDYCRAAGFHPLDSIVVVGSDADIVLQGLATVPVRNFFVFLRKYNISSRKPKNYVVSVWEMARSFERLFPNESSGVRIDFILISLLNGNGTCLCVLILLCWRVAFFVLPRGRGSEQNLVWS